LLFIFERQKKTQRFEFVHEEKRKKKKKR